LLQDRLELAVAEAQRSAERHVAILFLDLDHFKLVNDSLGHVVGDRLLKEVAARLSSCTRPYDTVARMGGDEYVILLTAIAERSVAMALAERIHGIMARPFVIDGHQLHVTTSIGIRFSEHSDTCSQALLRDADAALYRAKALGRSQSVVFEPTLHQAVAARLALETDLRIAWQQRQFTLAFQPITVLETGELRGFEALLRWQHPTRGVVGPNLFIPILEESGLIIEVGAWVLRESCRQLASWRQQGQVAANAMISVNLSARQLYHPDLVADVRNVLESAGLPPEALQLEMTESMVLADGQVAQTLRGLRNLGVGLSLDDFVTGYSSLSALHDLPITAVKIDRAFVHAFGQDDRRRGMVRAILLMASELLLEVIAEGIESESQADALRAVSCTYGQGYYYARPMNPHDVERWLIGRECAT
jgi:diguanylate cyclase (GGDEF)-like protein